MRDFILKIQIADHYSLLHFIEGLHGKIYCCCSLLVLVPSKLTSKLKPCSIVTISEQKDVVKYIVVVYYLYGLVYLVFYSVKCHISKVHKAC